MSAGKIRRQPVHSDDAVSKQTEGRVQVESKLEKIKRRLKLYANSSSTDSEQNRHKIRDNDYKSAPSENLASSKLNQHTVTCF